LLRNSFFHVHQNSSHSVNLNTTFFIILSANDGFVQRCGLTVQRVMRSSTVCRRRGGRLEEYFIAAHRACYGAVSVTVCPMISVCVAAAPNAERPSAAKASLSTADSSFLQFKVRRRLFVLGSSCKLSDVTSNATKTRGLMARSTSKQTVASIPQIWNRNRAQVFFTIELKSPLFELFFSLVCFPSAPFPSFSLLPLPVLYLPFLPPVDCPEKNKRRSFDLRSTQLPFYFRWKWKLRLPGIGIEVPEGQDQRQDFGLQG